MDRMPRPPRLPPKSSSPKTAQTLHCDGEPEVLQGATSGTPTWDQFFDRNYTVDLNNDKFNVFDAGSGGPLVFVLHGGGHTALSWGHTAKLVKSSMHIVAFDCRGHGDTQCVDGEDYSVQRLTDDAVDLIKHIFNQVSTSRPKKPVDETAKPQLVIGPRKTHPGGPDVVICGHSMGGAIACRVAATGEIPNLKGLVVLDVVEGTAVQALPFMHGVVSKIPQCFESIDAAIRWALSSGTLKNKHSAALSIPSQLRLQDDKWVWRCDLSKTAPYWSGWFVGMSEKFLSAPCTKCLVVVGLDRLDKELMIAQMQGKFQYEVVSDSGHVIEEDNPARVATILSEFTNRYKIGD